MPRRRAGPEWLTEPSPGHPTALRSLHLPVAVTEGSLTENLNKTGVRLWTAFPLERKRERHRSRKELQAAVAASDRRFSPSRGRCHSLPSSARAEPDNDPPDGTGYTDVVPSIADDLRAQTTARVLAMPVADRIALALSLGDDDLELFARTSGLNRNAARRRLMNQRRRGRSPSACAAPPGL